MYTNIAAWIKSKACYQTLEELANQLGLSENMVEGLLNGEVCPTFKELVHIMAGLNLNTEETLELFSLVAAALELSPISIYESVVSEIVIMTEQQSKSFV